MGGGGNYSQELQMLQKATLQIAGQQSGSPFRPNYHFTGTEQRDFGALPDIHRGFMSEGGRTDTERSTFKDTS